MLLSAIAGLAISIACATVLGLFLHMRGARQDRLPVRLERHAVLASLFGMAVLCAAAGAAIAGVSGALCGILGALPLAAAGVNDLIGLRDRSGRHA